MSLSSLNSRTIIDDGIQSVTYKGWDVIVLASRHGYTVSVMKLLEENSDAAHVLFSNSPCSTLQSVMEEVRDEVGSYDFTAKQVQTRHDQGEDMINRH